MKWRKLGKEDNFEKSRTSGREGGREGGKGRRVWSSVYS
jgi:hypothetical protein